MKQVQRSIRGLFGNAGDASQAPSRAAATWQRAMAVVAVLASALGVVLATLTPSTAVQAQPAADLAQPAAPNVAFHYGSAANGAPKA